MYVTIIAEMLGREKCRHNVKGSYVIEKNGIILLHRPVNSRYILQILEQTLNNTTNSC